MVSVLFEFVDNNKLNKYNQKKITIGLFKFL